MMSEQYGSWSDEPDRQDPGNKRHWAQLLVERGDIDLLSPPFLDRAFGAGVESYGLIGMWPLGMSPVAQDSRGNTILHVAAARCDGRLLRFLGDKAIEATIRNARERTALEIMRIRTAENPRECAAAERYFEEQLIP